jgi:four helix bundle protein
MNNNIVYEKSKKFAFAIMRICGLLKEKKQFEISGQLFRSGTSIGANIAESKYASSKADFINKLSIALKEASETEYWLTLLSETCHAAEANELIPACTEIIKILTASIKTCKN